MSNSRQSVATSRNRAAEQDRAYIQRAIAFQRCLDILARLMIAASRGGSGWALGTAALATAKSIENADQPPAARSVISDISVRLCPFRLPNFEIHTSTLEVFV